MDARSIELLEFPQVRARLADATSFPPGRRLAEALQPSADPVIVARGLDETDQTRALLSERPTVGVGAAHDVGPAIERAARGGRLEPGQFLELAETLDATARLGTALADERRQLLRELGRALHPQPALRSTLARSFDPTGELLDTASSRLGGLRAAVRVAYDRLRRRLDSLVGSELGSALQEPIVTLRNGRYVVPIDIRLGDGYRALVVTGPNTGGKTVTLRTLGLLALMHQAGLHVPAAAGSRLPVFRDVYADIGDEQSIAQSLSTFSGHLRRIVSIVEQAAPGTLVLLDELGAGTDPTEGSALAQALLDHFIRVGALVAATTHYAELKAYAHTTPEARNAAVEFDLETLSPTYKLSIGLPGRSQAFAIADRLGLPDPIVSDARSRLTEAQLSFEATLAAIRETEGATADALESARSAEARAADALRAADEERRKARRERDEVVRGARDEAERLVENLRGEVRATRRLLERETVTAPAIDAALERAGEQLARLPVGERANRAVPEPASAPRTWQLGERARSRSQGWEGRLVALGRGGRRVTLETGGMRVTVPVDDLEVATAGQGLTSVATDGAAGGQGGSGGESLRLDRARSVASSLDLRGARVEEALELLDRYLNDAALAGLDRVTIIHGLGTGALRDAVRLEARNHPLVKSLRPGERGEGGDGATIVNL